MLRLKKMVSARPVVVAIMRPALRNPRKRKAKFRNLFLDITFGERAVLMGYPF
jgi:hypothetical protein